MPISARRQTNGPPSIDQGFSTGSCNSRYALSARVVHPPTSPCPTLSASAEPIVKMATDKMQPKSDNAKRRHQLKGKEARQGGGNVVRLLHA